MDVVVATQEEEHVQLVTAREVRQAARQQFTDTLSADGLRGLEELQVQQGFVHVVRQMHELLFANGVHLCHCRLDFVQYILAERVQHGVVKKNPLTSPDVAVEGRLSG